MPALQQHVTPTYTFKEATMDPEFITSLPEGADNVDFRVLAEEGGYADAIRALYARRYGRLSVTGQRDHQYRVFLQVTVIRDQIARDGNRFCFDGFVGEFLTLDGFRTGNFVSIETLSISPELAQQGQSVGVLRMRRIDKIPETIPEAI